MISIGVSKFPPQRNALFGKWRPIQFEPIPGSGEHLTLGVIAFAESK